MNRSRPDRKALGAVLRDLRQEKEFTQERLSIKSKLTTATISDTENGKHNLSFESIERWLGTLGVTWSEFGAALDQASRAKNQAAASSSVPGTGRPRKRGNGG